MTRPAKQKRSTLARRRAAIEKARHAEDVREHHREARQRQRHDARERKAAALNKLRDEHSTTLTILPITVETEPRMIEVSTNAACAALAQVIKMLRGVAFVRLVRPTDSYLRHHDS